MIILWNQVTNLIGNALFFISISSTEKLSLIDQFNTNSMKPSKDPTGNEKYTKIIDLKPFMKNVNIIFIVLEKGDLDLSTEIRSNLFWISYCRRGNQNKRRVCNCSCISCRWDCICKSFALGYYSGLASTWWHNPSPWSVSGSQFKILILFFRYSTIFKHSLSLYCGRFGTIERIGE